MFYNFNQNNSGGIFIVDDKVCQSLFIEADSASEAVSIAESLGCYWNGVTEGRDCPCCGDRWSCKYLEPISLEKYSSEGVYVCVWDGIYRNTVKRWEDLYKKFTVIESPKFITQYTTKEYGGRIQLRGIEEYAQYLADEYSWTTPDSRIYYKNGSVKEIFSIWRQMQ